MFLVDMDAPGFRIVRQLETLEDTNGWWPHAGIDEKVRVSSSASWARSAMAFAMP